jgi:hypothetical protein
MLVEHGGFRQSMKVARKSGLWPCGRKWLTSRFHGSVIFFAELWGEISGGLGEF